MDTTEEEEDIPGPVEVDKNSHLLNGEDIPRVKNKDLTSLPTGQKKYSLGLKENEKTETSQGILRRKRRHRKRRKKNAFVSETPQEIKSSTETPEIEFSNEDVCDFSR